MAKIGFNTSEYGDFTSNFDPIPDGEYEMMGTEAEDKETAAKTGSYVKATFEIVGGEFNGRKVWNNFNTVNPSAKAEELGRMQLASWARAVGKPNAQDTDELLNLVFIGKVTIEKGTDGYKDQNRLEGYKSKIGVAGKPPAAKPGPKPGPKPAATVTPLPAAAPAPVEPIVADPFAGLPAHVAVAVNAAGGLTSPAGAAIFAALTANATPTPAAPAPAPAAPAAVSAGGKKAPWDA